MQNAIEHFDLAIKYDPSYLKTYCNKGYILSLLKRYSEAIESCNIAINMIQIMQIFIIIKE
ncbi:hypothetical protein [Orientia tsutsugamushi]|uniref:Tetratricopeptide repeat family protein n=2 Tax=Orientia tsutsugamushi TaxID=784 RepID=A0A0F3NQI0_ORITS|nr:hypothetical protein [Orientia tsutsugamushi]KJV70335.1 tetratricopeptide repeat family protein [Orientia tsutsugamushi str. TA716]KJV75457.1 tetratricopeptide repeat family protein [Orientia tsutsugamushi str. TA716]SPM45084.1 TPR repeat-containing protein 03 [Orientia tsutsugamushi]